MSRYTIHAVKDSECNSFNALPLARTDSVVAASALARRNSNLTYGACVVDHETGLVDYGHGFGVPVELPEAD